MVAPAGGVVGGLVDPHRRRPFEHGFGCGLVVDAPPGIVAEGAAAIGPPGVGGVVGAEASRHVIPLRSFWGLTTFLRALIHGPIPLPRPHHLGLAIGIGPEHVIHECPLVG